MERILIVEDSPTQRELLKYTLEKNHYDIRVATNGKEALNLLAECHPTLIVTDILMPEMDGYALCSAIKANPEFKHIPVILLTSLSDPADVIAGLQCGADSFVGKPFDTAYLLSRIENVFANRQIGQREKADSAVEIASGGKRYLINAGKPQILDLLLSVYEAAVKRNNDLAEAQQELRQLNEDLERKVQERTAKLEESNRSLEAFCYSIAHDLRAPLRAIQGFVSILATEYGQAFDDTAQDYARRTCAAADRMDQLIQGLLAFGKISHSEVSVKEVDVDATVHQVISDFATEIQARDASVMTFTEGIFVSANPILLRQILQNLVDNALKFARPNVPLQIVIEAKAEGDIVRVSVADNGLGIAPPYHEKIFQLFEKLHAGEKFAGTGIGLALVRKAVERMGGHITVQSELNSGSRFDILLPKPRLAEDSKEKDLDSRHL